MNRVEFDGLFGVMQGIVDIDFSQFSVTSIQLLCVKHRENILFIIMSVVTSQHLFRDIVFNVPAYPIFVLFLLNKLLNNSVLHSLLTLKSVVIPTLLWILPEQCNQMGGQHLCDHKEAIAIYSFLRSGLVEIFYVSATFYMLICFLFVKNVTDHVSVLGIPINTQISNLLWCTKLFNLH